MEVLVDIGGLNKDITSSRYEPHTLYLRSFKFFFQQLH